MVLLDRGADDACHANAVAAHFIGAGFARFVQERGFHRVGVFGAQLKYVSHFDAAADVELAFAVGTGVARDDIADVGHEHRLGQVAPEVRAGKVMAFLVRAADEIGQHRDRAVGNDPDSRVCADRADISRFASKMALDFRVGGEPKRVHSRQLLCLDLVQAVVAAQEQQHEVVLMHDSDGLDGLRERRAEQDRDILAARHARGRDLAQ